MLASLAALALSACDRRDPTAHGSRAAPTQNVITIGVGIGACPDISICERECDGGSSDRCRRLAASYAFGQGVAKDEARAAVLYEHACDMGDAPSCMFAGQQYEFAHGVSKDAGEAVRFYRRACDIGWAPGCYNLAIMFELGRGVGADSTAARDLYRAACSGGVHEACDKAAEVARTGP